MFSLFCRFLLHREVLKFWSNKTFGWECTCHKSLLFKKKNFPFYLIYNYLFTKLLITFHHNYYDWFFNSVDFFKDFFCTAKYWNSNRAPYLLKTYKYNNTLGRFDPRAISIAYYKVKKCIFKHKKMWYILKLFNNKTQSLRVSKLILFYRKTMKYEKILKNRFFFT